MYDQTIAESPATQIVISSRSAEKFLGVKCRDFSSSQDVRDETIRKLKLLVGKPAELCVEKIGQTSVLYASNSVIKF